MDGTLTNSEPAWFDACNETLMYYGKNKIEKEVYEHDFVGTTVMINIVKMFPEFSTAEMKKAEGMYKDKFEKRLGQILIKENAIEMLELVRRKHLKCGLVTNTPRGIVEDSVTGVMSGKAAGCFTVGVTAVLGKGLLKEAGADMVLDDIGQLSEIIKNA